MSKKICLIEDDKFMCRAYQIGFENAGFNVSVSFDGIEGMEKIKIEKPDLVLLDLILPKKHGFEVLQELKANKKFRHIPVIIISNLSQASDVAKGMSMGALDYLVKTNYSTGEVVEKIKSYLALK